MKFNISQVKKIIKEEVDKLLKEKGDVLSLSDYFGVEDFTADDARELKSISSRIKQDVTDEHELRAINTIEKVVDELASRSTGSDEVESGDEELLAAGKINEIDEEDELDSEKEPLLIRKPPLRWKTYKSITIREIGIYMYLTTKARSE